MPEPVVEAHLAASPAAVLASLTAHVAALGGELDAVTDFGSVVTWRVFDGRVDLVRLRAEVTPGARPGITHLVVRRVDPALEAALDCTVDPADRGHDGHDVDARGVG